MPVEFGFDVYSLKSAVCVKFIRSGLASNIQRIYEPRYFYKHDIVNEQGIAISDANLKRLHIINAKILYDYAEIKN